VTPGAAWLVAGQRADTIARWRPRRATTAKLAVAGDLVAAGCSGPRQVADVIWCGAGSSHPAARLATVLGRYPGCAVAAIRVAGSGCLVAPRTGGPLFFHNEQWFHTLVCAMFVHGWLAAGRPLADLDPSRLEAAAGLGASLVNPIPFAMYYEDEPVSSSVSRRRICSASGASISV